MYSSAKVASVMYKRITDTTNDKIVSLARRQKIARRIAHAFFLGPNWSALFLFLRPRTEGGEWWFSSSDIVTVKLEGKVNSEGDIQSWHGFL